MPLSLATRIGEDTIGKMEAAARRRYAEASRLVANEPLGAIYLFGYTVEIRLKTAYYRIIGIRPDVPLDKERAAAERQIRAFPVRATSRPAGHDTRGWARLVEHARATTTGAKPLAPSFLATMNGHADDVADCWTEILRYRANKPYNKELAAVLKAARWFKRNHSRLWN